jgi:hypothetical protein
MVTPDNSQHSFTNKSIEGGYDTSNRKVSRLSSSRGKEEKEKEETLLQRVSKE